jgi:hypothetical protein
MASRAGSLPAPPPCAQRSALRRLCVGILESTLHVLGRRDHAHGAWRASTSPRRSRISRTAGRPWRISSARCVTRSSPWKTTLSVTAPLASCVAEVAHSDLYVGTFGWRYGFVPQEAEGRSITEDEYEAATAAGIPSAHLPSLRQGSVAVHARGADRRRHCGEEGQSRAEATPHRPRHQHVRVGPRARRARRRGRVAPRVKARRASASALNSESRPGTSLAPPRS